jgi:hypothetical protein
MPEPGSPQITDGRGYIFSCNYKTKCGENVGIGAIKRSDEKSCRKVVNAMSYLTSTRVSNLQEREASGPVKCPDSPTQNPN